jgi:hypothetical protein
MMPIVDGAFIASEDLLIVAVVLFSIVFVALVVTAVTAIYYDRPVK